MLPSGVELISSRVFGYYNQGNSITERVSKEESILSRVSSKNIIFSIGCWLSVEIRFTNLLSPKNAEDNYYPSGHKQFILAVIRQLSSECRYMQVKSEKDLSCLHRVSLCLNDSISSRVPAIIFFLQIECFRVFSKAKYRPYEYLVPEYLNRPKVSTPRFLAF